MNRDLEGYGRHDGVDDHDSFRRQQLKDAEVEGARRDSYARSNLVLALANVRTKLGMSQRDVASLMHTTQSAISDLENGATDPRLSTLQRYARAVQCEIELELMTAPR